MRDTRLGRRLRNRRRRRSPRPRSPRPRSRPRRSRRSRPCSLRVRVARRTERASEHRADEEAGKEAAAEEAAGPRRERGTRLPVGDALAVHRHLPRVRLLAVLDANGVRGTRRHRARLPARGRPLDVGHGRTVARIEEAGRAPLGGLLPRHLGLGRLHGPAPLLQQLRDPLQVLGPPRQVERLARLGVALDGEAVVLLGLGVHVRHLHVDVERSDVVAERHHVVARDLAHLGELGLLLLPALSPAGQAEDGERHGQDQQEQKSHREAAPVAASRSRCLAGARVADPAREVPEHGGRSGAALGLEGLRRELAGLTAREHAVRGPRAEGVADDRGVHPRLAHRLRELAQGGLRVATRLVCGRGRKEGDVHRTRVLAGDRLAEAVRLTLRDRPLGLRIHVDRILSKALRGVSEPILGVGGPREHQQRG